MRRTLLALALVLVACKEKPAPADLAAPVDLRAPKPAWHAVPLQTPSGQPTTLSAYHKKVTFVVMWATFCEPCMQELPLVEALYQKVKASAPDVSIVAVSADEVKSAADREHVAEVAKQLGLTMPVLLDTEGALAARLSHPYREGDDEPNADAGAPELSLPTAAVFDERGRYHRGRGFPLGATAEQYTKDHLALFDAARRGALPEEDKSEDTEAGGGEVPDKITMPAMTKEAYVTKWPPLRKQLKDMVGVDEKTLQAADRQAKSGKPITIDLRKVNGAAKKR